MAKLNPNISYKQNKLDLKHLDELVRALVQEKDRFALSKAITLVESENKTDQELAEQLLLKIGQPENPGFRIGITGSPGTGKSTLIEGLGLYLIEKGLKPAILAIDPSSESTGGSILGDKTRMQNLSQSTTAFIRPSPAGKSLGGVARKTRESTLLLEAAKYDPILVETVGVGQSETTVKWMTDLFILIISPGSGDEIQGIKRGIVELADIIVINKMDGALEKQAVETMHQYANALHILRPKSNGWKTEIIGVSAIENKNIDALWDLIIRFKEHINENKIFDSNRKAQNLKWFEDHIQEGLNKRLLSIPFIQNHYNSFKEQVITGERTPFHAANTFLNIIESGFER